VSNTKLKGVQFRNEGTPLGVRDLHHEGVGLVSNLGMIPKTIICSFVRFEGHKMQSYVTR